MKRFLVFLMVFLFGWFVALDADEIDTSNSSVGLGVISDITSNLEGVWESLKRSSNVANLKNTKNELIVQKYGFNNLQKSSSIFSQSLAALSEESADIAPAITNPLVYPNPFRQSTSEGAVMGYELSKAMDFEVQIYNMLGQLVLQRSFVANGAAAQKGYNKFRINNETFKNDGFNSTEYLLSSGVYVYVFIHEGQVMSKGKMVVKP